MRGTKKRTGLAAGVAATMLIAPAAFATTMISVGGSSTPVGNVAIGASVKAPGVSFLSNFGIPTSCTASSITGYVVRGTVAAVGTKIGAISNLVFTGCTSAGGLPLVIKKNTNPGEPAEWPIHVVGTPAKGQVNIPIQIRNISVKMHSTLPAVPSPMNKWPCYLKAEGTLNATFNQTTQQIAINTAPSFPFILTTYDGASETAKLEVPSTCGGWFYTGDTANMTGLFNVTSPGIGGIHL